MKVKIHAPDCAESFEDFIENGIGHLVVDNADNYRNKAFSCIVDAETGVIENCNNKKTISMMIKPCDEGSYSIWNGDVLVKEWAVDYVPEFLDTEGDSFGDYIEFVILPGGKIRNWKSNAVKEILKDIGE